HIARINKEGSYYISLNGLSQTPATEEEMNILEDLKKEVLTRNYSWREAREVARNVNRLRIYIDNKFPHNIEQIVQSFRPIVITFFDKLENNDLKDNITIESIRARATLLLSNLNIANLIAYFTSPNKDSIDEYLKRMILSGFDIPRIVFQNYDNSFKNTLEFISEELAKTSTLSEKTCEILFADSKINKLLLSLTHGILKSLCHMGPINDLLSYCSQIQTDLNCNRGTVGYHDVNTLRLPDGSIIHSTYVKDIKPQYAGFQQEYAFYYQNAGDAEFVEGCVELLGNIILTQIFREGNKRTAKCLFNKLLLSRGIIPPITDLNENESELWNSIAYGRFDRYPATRERLLRDTIAIKEMLKDSSLKLPTIVSPEAVYRDEFKRRSLY
ncbi:MAG: Fic family protein, partial [Bacilli bacterium]|nr:Fic family protein [Bacilli bacterium]